MSRVYARADFGQPTHSHTWRPGGGRILASVDVGGADFTFDDPGDARAVAAECIKAAEAMEQMAAETRDFGRYCDEREIQPGEEPAAFAAWLHELSGGTWDGDMGRVGEVPADDGR